MRMEERKSWWLTLACLTAASDRLTSSGSFIANRFVSLNMLDLYHEVHREDRFSMMTYLLASKNKLKE